MYLHVLKQNLFDFEYFLNQFGKRPGDRPVRAYTNVLDVLLILHFVCLRSFIVIFSEFFFFFYICVCL